VTWSSRGSTVDSSVTGWIFTENRFNRDFKRSDRWQCHLAMAPASHSQTGCQREIWKGGDSIKAWAERLVKEVPLAPGTASTSTHTAQACVTHAMPVD